MSIWTVHRMLPEIRTASRLKICLLYTSITPRHAITALFSCCFKCPCPTRRQPHFRSNPDRAYNTLHFASKVVCQGASPFGNPGQQNRPVSYTHLVRGFPTHLETSLAAGIVSVRYPLLYGFPLKLGEHDTDVYKRQALPVSSLPECTPTEKQ